MVAGHVVPNTMTQKPATNRFRDRKSEFGTGMWQVTENERKRSFGAFVAAGIRMRVHHPVIPRNWVTAVLAGILPSCLWCLTVYNFLFMKKCSARL